MPVPSPPAPSPPRRGVRDAAIATAAYLCLTILMTWPVAGGLTTRVPSDLGDPLLNAWILAWDADHLGRAAHGDVGALGEYWNANIFHPERGTLAYSEHLTPQALQILPVYALTKNPLLCYNLIFLSTFVLSGLGAFLLARDITGSRGAAFLAGVAFAFAPYRFGALPQIQVLSSAWMPFALLGFRRCLASGRTTPLAWGSLAWLAQNLSCGYYLLFFSPIVAMYAAWEVTTRRLWTTRAVLMRIAAAGAAVALATLPFLLPYVALRRSGFNPRSLTETISFSADAWAYLTAESDLWIWGHLMRAWPKAEGQLFPGLTISALAIAAVAVSWRAARPRTSMGERKEHAGRIAGWLTVATALVALGTLLGGALRASFAGLPIKVTGLDRTMVILSVSCAAWLAASRRGRSTVRTWLASPTGILAIIVLFAVVMSWGPEIHTRGRSVSAVGLYLAFYNWFPGFDGVRVPARFGMIVALGLSLLAACAVATFERRYGWRVAAVACALVLVESLALPITTNFTDTNYRQRDLAPLAASVEPGDRLPAVYRFVQTLPASAVIAELPLGEPAFDVRYMYYSTWHWRRLVNGYSGGIPLAYDALSRALQRFLDEPAEAWSTLAGSGATHVIVHAGSFRGGRGDALVAWLRTNGAREIATFDTDRVFALQH